ncbi:unnamed protein product [Nezara viridula]|uniref:Neuropeptide n=1 Tax=Nezara viridula TaxID=85310 RepID=A0A9P0HLV2_NEZVI|nr:unnamed protein product [Nezara viridula]
MSTLSITSQLWDLMSLLTLLFRKTTKEYDDGSIAALERISTYGDSIKDIYGPFLFIVVSLHYSGVSYSFDPRCPSCSPPIIHFN